ncbi:MAG TPA: hypothetical protein VMH01_11755, partial [Puia sp.]|nr:hypothetical protein [Puia sp.]
MRIKSFLLNVFLPLLLVACVSTKKFKDVQQKYDALNKTNAALQNDLNSCNSKVTDCNTQRKADADKIDNLNKQIAFLKENNTQALKQLEDLSVISSSQAESIKKSLENIGAKDAYIQSLQTALARKDSLNLALVQNLKGAIGNMDDKDIDIKVDKGVVYIDISDKLLFKSGSYDVT